MAKSLSDFIKTTLVEISNGIDSANDELGVSELVGYDPLNNKKVQLSVYKVAPGLRKKSDLLAIEAIDSMNIDILTRLEVSSAPFVAPINFEITINASDMTVVEGSFGMSGSIPTIVKADGEKKETVTDNDALAQKLSFSVPFLWQCTPNTTPE